MFERVLSTPLEYPELIGSFTINNFVKSQIWPFRSPLWIFYKNQRKALVLESDFRKVTGAEPVTLVKKELQQSCFPIRTGFWQNISEKHKTESSCRCLMKNLFFKNFLLLKFHVFRRCRTIRQMKKHSYIFEKLVFDCKLTKNDLNVVLFQNSNILQKESLWPVRVSLLKKVPVQ